MMLEGGGEGTSAKVRMPGSSAFSSIKTNRLVESSGIRISVFYSDVLYVKYCSSRNYHLIVLTQNAKWLRMYPKHIAYIYDDQRKKERESEDGSAMQEWTREKKKKYPYKR